MRYKVRQTEVVEFILEADTYAEAEEFLMCYTNRELRAIKPDIETMYSSEIVEKTVMPADFNSEDEIPMIPDEFPEYYQKQPQEESYSLNELPFN